MSDINFLKDYFNNLKKLIDNEKYFENLVKVKDILKKTHSEGKKTMIFGNGGSAAIASHFSVDLTKNAKVRCTNYNESDLLTCFSNDYGYERWVEKALSLYAERQDRVIFISVSGKSQNLLNGIDYANYMNIDTSSITGSSINNPLKQKSKNYLWVNCKAYNIVESVHTIWITLIIDLIIGSPEYEVN